MINKYAEIQDRIILYNACKGILRVKIAKFDEYKQEVKNLRAQGVPREQARAQAEANLGREHGVNPYAQQQTATATPDATAQQQTPADPNAQQQGTSLTSYVPGAIGAVGGAVGAGYLGNKATGWLNKKLGLTKDRGGWRKWLGRGIQTAGTLGAGLTGAFLGGNITDSLAGGWGNNSLENAKQRAARKAQRQAEIDQAAQQAVEPQA